MQTHDKILFLELKEVILKSWENWGLGPVPVDISFIRRSSTWLGDAGKEVYFIFQKGDVLPSLFAKTVASADYGATINKEANNVRYVRNSISPICKNHVPQPLGIFEINDIPIYFEKATPGIVFPDKVNSCWLESSKKKLIERTVFEISKWISEFQNALGGKQIVVNSEFIEEQFIQPISKFKIKNILKKQELKYLHRIEHLGNSMEGESLLIPPVHGDLWGGSLLWGIDKKLYVIDWEFFEPAGLPLYDFLYFAIHPGFVIAHGQGIGLLSEFMNLFYNNYFSKLIREHLIKNIKTAGIESWEVIELLLATLLVRLSLERDNRKDTGDSWKGLLQYLIEDFSCFEILKI